MKQRYTASRSLTKITVTDTFEHITSKKNKAVLHQLKSMIHP